MQQFSFINRIAFFKDVHFEMMVLNMFIEEFHCKRTILPGPNKNWPNELIWLVLGWHNDRLTKQTRYFSLY